MIVVVGDCLADWLADWWTDRLIGWLADWLIRHATDVSDRVTDNVSYSGSCSVLASGSIKDRAGERLRKWH